MVRLLINVAFTLASIKAAPLPESKAFASTILSASAESTKLFPSEGIVGVPVKLPYAL